MTKVEIGGKTYRLCLNMDAMAELEEEFGLKVEFSGKWFKTMMKSWKSMTDFFAVLARQGMILKGEKAQTRDEIARKIKPGATSKMSVAIWKEIENAMNMETEEGDESDEVDVVLEELRKNAEADA